MPLPSNDPVLKWEYTFVENDAFRDGRQPAPVLLMYRGFRFPRVVIEAPLPEVTMARSGPWWFPQDLAATEGLLSVLWSAAHFKLVPVISPRMLNASTEVEVIAMRSLSLVSPARDEPGDRRTDQLRQAMRALLSAPDEHASRAALDHLLTVAPPPEPGQDPTAIRTFRIGLVRFPYRPWREGPPTSRVIPVLLKPSRPRGASESDSNVKRVLHPARQSLQAMHDLLPRIAGGDSGALDEFLNATPSLRVGSLRMLGHAFNEHGQNDAALAVWTHGDASGDGESSYELACLLREQGDLDHAMETAERSDQRGSPRGAFLHAELLAAAGHPESAMDAYRRADSRGDGPGAFRLAECLIQRGDLDEAEAAMRRADERGTPPAATMLGIRLHEKGQEVAAATALQRGDDRGDKLAPFILGHLALEDGREAEAEAAWRRADERGHAEAAVQLAELALRRNQPERAEAALRRAIENGAPSACDRLARLLIEQGREADAIDALRAGADEDDSGTATRSKLLAMLLTRQGNQSAADDAWQRAAEIGDELASYEWARILLNRGEFSRAWPFLNRAFESEDISIAARAWLVMGQLELQIGDAQKAAIWLARVAASNVEDLAPIALNLLDEVAARGEDAQP